MTVDEETYYASCGHGLRFSFHHGPLIHGVGRCAYPAMRAWAIIQKARPTTMGFLLTRCAEEIPAILAAFKTGGLQGHSEQQAGKLDVLTYDGFKDKIEAQHPSTWISQEVAFFLHWDTFQEASTEIATGRILTHLYEMRAEPRPEWTADVVCISGCPPHPQWMSMLRRFFGDEANRELETPTWKTDDEIKIERKDFEEEDGARVISEAIQRGVNQYLIGYFNVVVVYCDERWMGAIISERGSATPGVNVSILTANKGFNSWHIDREPSVLEKTSVTIFVVIARPEERLTLPKLANVAAVVCWGKVKLERQFVLGPANLHEVHKPRDRSLQEMEEQMAMLPNNVRAHGAANGRVVTAVYVPRQARVGRFFRASLNTDIYKFVLHMVGNWPNVQPRSWPVLVLPSVMAVTTVIKRLDVMGCLDYSFRETQPATPRHPGSGSLLGRPPTSLVLRSMGDWIVRRKELASLRFQAAYLALTIRLAPGLADPVKHALNRMAAVLDEIPRALLQITPPKHDEDDDDYMDSIDKDIPLTLHGHYENGYLWMALGIFMQFEDPQRRARLTGRHPRDWQFVYPGGKISVRTDAILRVLQHVDLLDAHSKHGPAARERCRDKALTEDDILEIDSRLLKASLFKTLLVTPPESVVDIATGRDMASTVVVDVDIINDWTHVLSRFRSGGDALLLAVYNQLSVFDDAIQPMGITMLRPSVFTSMERTMDLDLFHAIQTGTVSRRRTQQKGDIIWKQTGSTIDS